MQIDVAVRVDIPALADFVEYLREVQQGKIEALAVEVEALTARLKQSSDGLKQAMKDERTST